MAKELRAKNRCAVRLGSLGRGHPKNYSREEIAKRTARLPHKHKASRKGWTH